MQSLMPPQKLKNSSSLLWKLVLGSQYCSSLCATGLDCNARSVMSPRPSSCRVEPLDRLSGLLLSVPLIHIVSAT